ncbi:MAG: tetratricopeptide repeat protein [Pseudomonadota bacterium]
MSETSITVRAQFSDQADAQAFLDRLSAAASEHGDELSAAIASLTPVGPHAEDDVITLERLRREDDTVVMLAYAGRIDPPVWFVKGLARLGAQRTAVFEVRDDGGATHYFIGAKKASKKAFEAAGKSRPEPCAPPGSDLFLPQGRVTVKARLLSHVWKTSFLERYCVMRMQTEEGRHFVYKGTSALTGMSADDQEKTCQFSAVFELGELDGETVSFAKRPTKIQLGSVSATQVAKEKFTGSNKAFIEGPFGPVVLRYLNELGGKPDAFIQHLGATSVLGLELVELLARLKRIDAASFDGFGHYLSLRNGTREVFELYTVGDTPIDLEQARQHLNQLPVSPLYKDDSHTAVELSWAVGDIDVHLKVWRNGFELKLRRLPGIERISWVERYKLFNQHPGMAGNSHWLDLFLGVRKAAEAGDVACMTILGYLYNLSHQWRARDQAQAERWWVQAAEQGDKSAMRALGDAYTAWGGWPRDLAKGEYYLKLAAAKSS